MSLKNMLLSLIEISPLPGYDILKIFETSMLFYWHATHTQIYSTLKQLEKDALITGEVIHQVGNPSKRVFSITEKGKDEIKNWLIKEPVLTGFKHEFLMKLSFSSQLSDEEIISHLITYKDKLKSELTKLESDKKFEYLHFARNDKERLLWKMTFENGMMYYHNEIEWTDKVIKQIRDNIHPQKGS